MGLISAKNFTAPFTNKVHLAAMLFVACLFAAYRLSGGGISIQSTTEPQGQLRPAVTQSAGQERPRIRREAEVGRDRTAEARLEDLLNEGRRASPAGETDESQREKGALDEIEKQLGLR